MKGVEIGTSIEITDARCTTVYKVGDILNVVQLGSKSIWAKADGKTMQCFSRERFDIVKPIKEKAVSKATKKAGLVRSVMDSIVGGQFFGVLFEKADGSLRLMNCRKGVSKGVSGTGSARKQKADAENGNMTVWDSAKEGFRTIPLDRVQHIRVSGQTINFN